VKHLARSVTDVGRAEGDGPFERPPRPGAMTDPGGC